MTFRTVLPDECGWAYGMLVVLRPNVKIWKKRNDVQLAQDTLCECTLNIVEENKTKTRSRF